MYRDSVRKKEEEEEEEEEGRMKNIKHETVRLSSWYISALLASRTCSWCCIIL
jgi:hypothetical protein